MLAWERVHPPGVSSIVTGILGLFRELWGALGATGSLFSPFLAVLSIAFLAHDRRVLFGVI